MKMVETMKRISTEKIVIPGILLGVAIVLVLVDRIFDYHISGTLFWEYPKVCVNLQTDVR